ncbi:alpha/beta-hydrolase [Schizopora paradoxa]|uniref:triacylglycerol lipase n=1 Tax=Schizopora paradoxa TaxID=27342 RepID=A0A0H2SD49_9AGAM|nr:alpha/beta-hydrolase [Schizopora paradoxa]
MFLKLPNALQLLLAPALLFFPSENDNAPNVANPKLKFELRHAHAITNDSRIIFADVATSFQAAEHIVGTRSIMTHRPQSFTAFSKARARMRDLMESDANLWQSSETVAPDVQDRDTLLELAKMTSNAYFSKDDKSWRPLSPYWGNTSYPFGWEPDADGFRGHIFVSQDNSTVALSIKGTSAGWLAGDNGPTVKKDQLNDNLLFSCCCARVGPTWSTVCGCYSGAKKCDVNCLQSSLVEDSLFYNVAINLFNNVTYMYPEANIWLIGHSLGGGLASLLGATFGAPVVAFEAPGERLASTRLHLPSPPSTHHITHVYHTADSIPQGVCTGVTSACAIGGYALETGCHLGRVIKYDTVTELGWKVGVMMHGIEKVIDNVLSLDWEVPSAEEEKDCVDCFDWEFGSFKE